MCESSSNVERLILMTEAAMYGAPARRRARHRFCSTLNIPYPLVMHHAWSWRRASQTNSGGVRHRDVAQPTDRPEIIDLVAHFDDGARLLVEIELGPGQPDFRNGAARHRHIVVAQ